MSERVLWRGGVRATADLRRVTRFRSRALRKQQLAAQPSAARHIEKDQLAHPEPLLRLFLGSELNEAMGFEECGVRENPVIGAYLVAHFGPDR